MHIKSKCLHLNNVIIEKYNLNEEEKAALKENIKDLKKLYMKNAQPEFENLQVFLKETISCYSRICFENQQVASNELTVTNSK